MEPMEVLSKHGFKRGMSTYGLPPEIRAEIKLALNALKLIGAVVKLAKKKKKEKEGK